MTDALAALISSGPFRVGALVGLGAVALVAVVRGVTAARHLPARPAPVAGLALGFATALAAPAGSLGPGLLAGTAIHAVLVTSESRLRPGRPALLSAVPGAIVVSRAAATDNWLPLAGIMVVLGALAGMFDGRRRDLCPAPGLLALAAAGVYVTVPDTEGAAGLLGAAAVLAIAGWPLRYASLGAAGSAVAVATVVAVAAHGGPSFPTSIPAAIACLGLLPVEPIGRLLGRRLSWRPVTLPASRYLMMLFLAQAGVVLVASRVAGQTSRPAVSAAVLVAAAVAAVVTGGMLEPSPGPRTGTEPSR